MAAAGSKKQLTVSAPLVVVTTESGAVRHHYFGDVLGDDVSKESLEHLKALGYVSDGSDDK